MLEVFLTLRILGDTRLFELTLLDEKWEQKALQKNENLIKYLKDRRVIRDPRVEHALRKVPRHHFLTTFSTGYRTYDLREIDDIEETLLATYADDALMISFGDYETPMASISQPSVVVEMLEALELKEGQRVLEIGTGTGWNAALLASIVGIKGRVYTMEISEELAQSARERFLAYEMLEVINLIVGDGRFGYEEGSPYERIICTAGTDFLYVAWIEQICPGGIMVVPTNGSHDYCPMLKIIREKEYLIVKNLSLARFVPLIPKRSAEFEPEGIPIAKLIEVAEKRNGTYRLTT